MKGQLLEMIELTKQFFLQSKEDGSAFIHVQERKKEEKMHNVAPKTPTLNIAPALSSQSSLVEKKEFSEKNSNQNLSLEKKSSFTFALEPLVATQLPTSFDGIEAAVKEFHPNINKRTVFYFFAEGELEFSFFLKIAQALEKIQIPSEVLKQDAGHSLKQLMEKPHAKAILAPISLLQNLSDSKLSIHQISRHHEILLIPLASALDYEADRSLKQALWTLLKSFTQTT